MEKTKQLGNSGLQCPRIIYGTSYLGNLYRELTKEEKFSIIKEWFRVSDGRVMIDSAGKYGAGLALEVIGEGLGKLNVAPDDILISNKLGWFRVPLTTKEPTFEPGAWANLKHDAVQKISYSGILECWEQGCELLGGRYKPLIVSVHDPDEYLEAATDAADREARLNDILGAYKALFELKEKGEVKAVGIGSKDWLVIKELYEKVKFDWVMFANKFTLFHHPKPVVDFIGQLGKDSVCIINSAIFNAGFITGGEYFDYRIVNRSDPEDKHLFDWRDKLFAICEKHNVTPGEACLKFSFSAPQVCSVALNPSKPKRMAGNKEILKMELPAEFWQDLKNESVIDSNYKYL
ncbi:aldo/keto reductase [Maribellus comscasis]|uniref:Aldo/keto reductase n=1 Tax=Maribellus comscasis TaxID=2681766 RepID=A0A6I6JZE3_9BACT|nr:aldo/keto reductase [Maribellus comscasis]QGY46520.1 aldo/keto reductase [Maribellus comscasis]